MTLSRWLPVVASLSAVLVLTSCTQTSAGTPMPDGTVSGGSEPDPTDSTASTEPPDDRPREIDLTGKDPCVIPQVDWSKFGITGPGKSSEHPDFKSPDCYYSGVGDVALVVTAGIGVWTEDRYNAEIDDAHPIEGYPTVTVASNVDQWVCIAAVDVADGQFLMTTASTDPDDPDDAKRCDLAYQLAGSAMKALVAS